MRAFKNDVDKMRYVGGSGNVNGIFVSDLYI